MGDTWYDGGWEGSGGAPIGRVVVVGLRRAKGERLVREAAMVGSHTGADFGQQEGGFVGDGTEGTRVRVRMLEYTRLTVISDSRSPRGNNAFAPSSDWNSDDLTLAPSGPTVLAPTVISAPILILPRLPIRILL